MQHRLPETLGEYARRQSARFHMPGHKGLGMGAFFNADLARWDITELSFSDNLSNPQGAIREAQQACAVSYGAAHSFFLVNGATAGLHALMLCLPKGSSIIAGRDCHRALLTGAALAGLEVSFVQPAALHSENLCGCVTPDALQAALNTKKATAVVITSPNYYGLCADIPALAAIAHRHGACLFVDAAHGAHFPFSPKLPASPAGYADAWVNSAHKTLNALGQAALLHIGSGMPSHAVQRALSVVQTSSPSYLLMASLDWARYTAELDSAWTDTVNRCLAFRRRIGSVLGISPLSASLVGQAGIADVDATRLVLDVSGRRLLGTQAMLLLEKSGIYIEMADPRRLVLICTPADDPKWYPRLLEALHGLPYGKQDCAVPALPPMPPQVLPLHQAMRAPAALCPLAESVGRVAADSVGVYPPGIPLWAPGERITADALAYLQKNQSYGASLFGVHNGMVAISAGE